MGAMDFETLVRSETAALTARLTSMLGGDRAAAEDVRQEAFARAWRSLPRELDADRQRAWLRRVAGNLAIDELRRRGRRPSVSFDAAGDAVGASNAAEPGAAHEALAQLPTADRFLLLLRFQAGFSHLEVAQLLGVTEEAARKRAARARAAFLRAYRRARSDGTPLVALLVRDEPPEPYVRWLEDAGARVRELHGVPSERELVLADALVFTGSARDLHSELYGEAPRALRGEPDIEQDRGDLAGVRGALALGLAFAGICRGHQLLNIASGGTLYQDVVGDGLTSSRHDEAEHRVETQAGGVTRSLVGRSARVTSTHHQAVRRLGRRLAPSASSPDGVIEMIERTDRRFAIGMQWHPEIDRGAGDRIAQALVRAAMERAA
jgi:putative glutamine amidotransferase